MGCASSSLSAAEVAALTRSQLSPVVWALMTMYGTNPQQVGFTDGHKVMSHLDEAEAQSRGSSLLYGELLPSAVDKLLDAHHLAGSASSVLCDLGMVRRC